MRKTAINHWENIEELEGLLFFAQSIDEMLFDYTLDSYKPLALNCRLICIECLNTIEEVRNGFMPKKNLQSVLEELKWSLKRDVAARTIMGKKFDFYISRIKPNEIKLKTLEETIRFIYNHFSDRRYLNQIKLSLKELICDGNQKQKIRNLTSSFLTELINYGYHPNHIYYQSFHFFFDSSKIPKIDSIELLHDFYDLFDFNRKKFTVVFIGSILFKEFKGTLNKYDIVVTKTYNCFSSIQDDLNFKKSRKANESFIICSNVESYDHHSAREEVENFLGRVTNLFNFYHHKQKPKINDTSVVSRVEDNFVVIIDKPIKSILKTKNDEYPDNAAQSVENVLSNVKLSHESGYRFSRSIDLHSAALTAQATENQILDLWAAVETLMPKSTDSSKDRIVQIADQLIPFLQINYIEKLLIEVHKDLKNWDQTILNQTLKGCIGYDENSAIVSVGAFLTLNENKELRIELYRKLEDFPLLKNRIYILHEMFNSPKNIKNVLNRHLIKINWHLRRIYRTRSLIIHSGNFPTYTPILIEHLHNYLDIFLKKVIDLATHDHISTIEQAVIEIQTTLSYHEDLLDKHQDEELNIDNFKETLLGIS